MKSTNTVCVSLDEKYVDVLERLARKAGSRSAAVRLLLDEYERAQRAAEIEAAYAAYFADAAAGKSERLLTEEMLSVAQWPRDTKEAGKRRAAKQRRTSG